MSKLSEGLQQELEAQSDPKNSRRGNRPGFYWSSFEMFFQLGIYDLDYFKGKRILDFGCGSVPRSLIWRECGKYGIDPLAEEFTKIEWNGVTELDGYKAVGGEVFVPELKDKFDVVIAVNSIDHCPEWKKEIDNIVEYLKVDGYLYLFVDVDKQHAAHDKMHFTIKMFELLDYIGESFDIKFKDTSSGFSRGSVKITLEAVKKE